MPITHTKFQLTPEQMEEFTIPKLFQGNQAEKLRRLVSAEDRDKLEDDAQFTYSSDGTVTQTSTKHATQEELEEAHRRWAEMQ